MGGGDPLTQGSVTGPLLQAGTMRHCPHGQYSIPRDKEVMNVGTVSMSGSRLATGIHTTLLELIPMPSGTSPDELE